MFRSSFPWAVPAAVALAGLNCAIPAAAQSAGAMEEPEPRTVMLEEQEEPPREPMLTPTHLRDALSCRSHEAALDFATALFLDDKRPGWMRPYKGEQGKGMLGLYGYRLKQPIAFMGREVSTVFFLKDWVVTQLPRQEAMALIAEQRMERAPIKATEQYYRFVDPENGPMLGAFEPTGDPLAALLAAASGAETPAAPPAEALFVGCNYAPVSREMFLEAAADADAMIGRAAEDIMGTKDPKTETENR
jgi:hypothetical protein